MPAVERERGRSGLDGTLWFIIYLLPLSGLLTQEWRVTSLHSLAREV